MKKRNFLKLAASGLAAVSASSLATGLAGSQETSVKNLASIDLDLAPISSAEKRQRIKKAQQLMQQQQVAAIVLEPGAALDYFAGIRWWRSERFTGLVIPAHGEAFVICPFFEQPSIEEMTDVVTDIHVWQEHENPFSMIKSLLAKRHISSGNIGFEHSVRYFVLKGVTEQLADFSHVSAEPITRGCRMYKSNHELQLMHKANEITLAAYQHVFSQLELGMTQAEVKSLVNSTQVALGGSKPWCLALFNEASAYPHGTKQTQRIKNGSCILLDSGCSFHGYQSDISRTLFFGTPSKQQVKIWQTVREGQSVAFKAAKIGKQAGSVDDAVRDFYHSQGLGPDYQLPGLSHRTGHGIGMEGHESVNFVKGEREILKPGMCFSNEPGIYLPEKFGVRLEDCLYMTKAGPNWFTQPPESFDRPLGKLAKLELSS